MEKFEITGGKKLEGVIRNQGSKNAALPILAASLLTDEDVILGGIPRIIDVKNMVEVLRATGARVIEGSEIRINSSNIHNPNISTEAAKKIRSSLLMPAVLISRFPSTRIPLPGGDSIGTRKIDAYILGLTTLGAKLVMNKDDICVEANKVKGAKIELVFPSVTSTEAILLGSVLAEGKTIITNVAKEPEVIDLANFLNKMGAKIEGAGTNTIKVTGVRKLHGTEFTIIPDRIVAGTLMTAAAITCGDLLIENVVPDHLTATILKLREAGARVSEFENIVRVESKSLHIKKSTDLITNVYPEFSTDMQPIFMALMTIANGTSRIEETLYDGRFNHVPDLRKMGAIIEVDKRIARVKGVKQLYGAKVEAKDIRAGAAVTLAGLAAEGVTEVTDTYQIDRGYDRLDEVLSNGGANVKRLSE